MIRMHVICEGHTEEFFVNRILSDYFSQKGSYLYPSLIGKSGHKGGNFGYERLLTDLRVRLAGDNKSYCTTFFDFYGLPTNFPGKQESKTKNKSADKAACLLEELLKVLRAELGEEYLYRFIPYVQMYEFEGLLFSDTQALAKNIAQETLADSFRSIRNQFDTPEEINDSPETAPSKRILKLFPEYNKPLDGLLVASEIGLESIRRECPLFDGWLKQIEALKL